MNLQEAVALVEKLELHFEEYASGKHGRQKKGILQLLSHWIAYDVHHVEREHEDFLQGTTALIQKLAEGLESLPEEAQADAKALALRATQLLLRPKPKQPRNDRDWYLAAAEYSAIPLLTWLSQDELAHFRARLLEHTPRRMMFPNQVKLLEAMEKLLDSAQAK